MRPKEIALPQRRFAKPEVMARIQHSQAVVRACPIELRALGP